MRDKKLGKKVIGAKHMPKLTVSIYTLNKELIYTGKGYKDIANYLQIPKSTVNNCCNALEVYNNKYIFINNLMDISTLDKIIELYNLKQAQLAEKYITEYDLCGNIIAKYATLQAASDATGISLGLIGRSCNGMVLQAGGFIFLANLGSESIEERLFKLVENSTKLTQTNYRKVKYKVIQYSLDNKIIAQYNSYKEAEENTGISKKAIMSNCNGHSNTAKGFIFKKINTEDTNYFKEEKKHNELSR